MKTAKLSFCAQVFLHRGISLMVYGVLVSGRCFYFGLQ